MSVFYVVSFPFFYGMFEFNALFEWMLLIYVIVELILVFQSDWQQRARLLTNENGFETNWSTNTLFCVLPLPQPQTLWHKRYDKSQNKCSSYLLFEATEPAQCQLNMCYTFGLMGCDMVCFDTTVQNDSFTVFNRFSLRSFFYLCVNAFQYLSATTLTTKFVLSQIWIWMIHFIKQQMYTHQSVFFFFVSSLLFSSIFTLYHLGYITEI